MKKFWSASNVKVYGGGVSEAGFLEDLSRMIGDHDRQTSSVTTGRGGRGVSHQLQRDRILDVADLAALPKGRAIVFGSGSRPTLIRTQPWMTGEYAAAVKASIAAYDPSPNAPSTRRRSQPRSPRRPCRCRRCRREFVRLYLRLVYRRRVDGRRRCWAGRWWEYEEAIIRLEALWRAWEHLRLDPATGMSVWWRDHADHHMAVLLDPDGPFGDPTEGEENTNRRGDPLPYVAPPDGLFADGRQQVV